MNFLTIYLKSVAFFVLLYIGFFIIFKKELDQNFARVMRTNKKRNWIKDYLEGILLSFLPLFRTIMFFCLLQIALAEGDSRFLQNIKDAYEKNNKENLQKLFVGEKIIVIINGKSHCGKSTFIKYCGEIAENVFELSSVELPKRIAEAIGWNGAKTDRDRRFLFDLKKLLVQYNDSPNIFVFSQIKTLSKNGVFFVNIREPEEIERFRESSKKIFGCDVFTLYIRNDNNELSLEDPNQDTENFTYDFIVNNNGTLDDMRKTAKNFLERIFNFTLSSTE